jgi:hypothetical protein
MGLRRRPLVLLSFMLLLAAWTAVAALTGADTGLLYLAPALILCAPLILGRYVGEEHLAGLAGRSPARRARRPLPLPAPRSHVQVMRRGARLVASSLAKRPPPGRAAFVTA